MEILSDQTYNSSFDGKVESIQYNVRLALTVAIRGSAKEKVHQKLDFWVTSDSSLVQKTLPFYNVLNN